MNARTLTKLTACFLLVATIASAGEPPTPTRNNHIIHGGSTGFNPASGDTIDLMGPTGSGAPHLGDFEAGWNGWTSFDWTQTTVTHWQVSDYNQSLAGNLAAWCGDISYEACVDSLDVVGGYSNSWHDILSYRTAVADPNAEANVTVTATLQLDTEPTYDYVHLSTKLPGDTFYTDLQSWDGTATVMVDLSTTFSPAELRDGTDVSLMFRFTSDSGWSDADCLFYGAGACQIDDITVTTSQDGQADIVSFTDFQDGTFGDWFAEFPQGVGDFSALWTGLRDLDPCVTNISQQVAFIDDGVVVPGTGGSRCIDWCYGPGGYIVNTTGGLAGPTAHLQNDIYSPVMSWPDDDYDGLIFSFDAYRHSGGSSDSPLVIYGWGVRSADTDGSAGNGVQVLAEQPFLDRGAFGGAFIGGPGYWRHTNDVTDLMNPGRDEIQVQMLVWELGWVWGWTGENGSPAPYFDNVSVKVFPYVGPSMWTREYRLANDNFPEVDAVNFGDLGSLHVRFDMADNISLRAHLRNDPGDSIVVDIEPVRRGAVLAGAPEIHYVIDANPVFNEFRTVATSGVALGVSAVGSSGIPVPGLWAFDLPDTGTLFPGDVLHYYIRAGDDVAGDVQYATMPADISGFGDFSHPLAYDSAFVVHALPTISADGLGGYEVPAILFWNDAANRGEEEKWYGAFDNLGLVTGRDYDIYDTNQPTSGMGNGLGGRTSGPALALYTELLYTAGNLSRNTLSNGDFEQDAGNDLGALLNWMAAGNKDLLLTGDGLASDLGNNAGDEGLVFLEDVLGLDVTTDNLRTFIGNQATPRVLATPGNGVIENLNSWVAFGGCPDINYLDGVTVRAGASRLAEFGAPYHVPGAYPFSAATLNIYNATNRVVSLPYDFRHIVTDPDAPATGLAARIRFLEDVLAFFGHAGGGTPTDVPQAGVFSVTTYPNPFNPATRLDYTIRAPGHLSLKIFDIRGQLVRTLIDGQVAESGQALWDGTDNGGAQVSSGVYFSEARMGAEVEVGKMALIK